MATSFFHIIRLNQNSQKRSNAIMDKRIVIDAFGGDYAPEEIIKGSIIAQKKHMDLHLLLAGDEERIRSIIDAEQGDQTCVDILPASQIITADEEPVRAIRAKKQSSLAVGLQAIVDGEADVFVSAGSTGAILAGATLIVGRIKGIKRPALAPLLPTKDGKFVMLLDCGANSDSKAAYLEQFALMGSIYMESVVGVSKPKVALLNNGSEAGKGNELTKQVYQLLEKTDINFMGNCEARYIMSGSYDVVVADGFSGNIALKSIEGTASMMMSLLKEGFMSSIRTKMGAMLAKPALSSLKGKMDYKSIGGAMLLGINGGIIKAHGNANAQMFAAAIEQGIRYIDGDVTNKIQMHIQESADTESEDLR